MTETTDAKTKPTKGKKYMLVRYGRMNHLGLFEHGESHVPRTPARVVVKTEKGLELGYLVGQLTAYRDGRFRFSEEQVASYFANSDINFSNEPRGKVIRLATAEDVSEEQHLIKIAEEEIACCDRFAKELGLKMKIVDAEHIFGGERIIFYFMADGRVDFRELVRKLAHEYQTRIEMRQIGSRDEAKLLGDVESCGQVCCCIRFLQLLKPVNMRMAKMQKATLDPSKISGYCGRLKCCLRYEDENYTQLKRKLPKRNTWVQTARGQGRVVDTQILTQLAVVEYEGGDREAVPVEETTILPAPPRQERAEGGDTPPPPDRMRKRPSDDKKPAARERSGKSRPNKRSSGGRNRRRSNNRKKNDG
jgi:cell fate regulator YaaT (PSP1 superfamily)